LASKLLQDPGEGKLIFGEQLIFGEVGEIT
jgi:hypothetical protein